MTNKKLKMAAMSVALTACVAASPLAANADAPEAAPQEKEPVAEETKKEENTAEPQDNKQSEKAQETLKDAEVKYDKEHPTTNPDGSQKLDGVIVTNPEGSGETDPDPNPDSGETNPNPNPEGGETNPNPNPNPDSGETDPNPNPDSGKTDPEEKKLEEKKPEEKEPEEKKPEQIGTAEKTEKSETTVETKPNPGAEPIVDNTTPPTVEKNPDGSTTITQPTVTPGTETTTTTGSGEAKGNLHEKKEEVKKEDINLDKELGKKPDISWNIEKGADAVNGYKVEEVTNSEDGNKQTLKLKKEEETTAEMTAEDIAKLVDAEKPTMNPDGTYTLTRTETVLDAEGNPQTRTTYITIRDNKVTTKTTTELTITRQKEKQDGQANIPTDVVLPEVELDNGKSLPYTKLDEMLQETGGKDANGVKDGEYTYQETAEDGTVREYTIKIDTTSTDQLTNKEIVDKLNDKLNSDRYSAEGEDIYYRADNGERVKLDVTQKAALRRNLSVNISVTETKKDTKTETPGKETAENEAKMNAANDAVKNALMKMGLNETEALEALNVGTLNTADHTFTATYNGKTYTLTYTDPTTSEDPSKVTVLPDEPGKTDIKEHTVTGSALVTNGKVSWTDTTGTGTYQEVTGNAGAGIPTLPEGAVGKYEQGRLVGFDVITTDKNNHKVTTTYTITYSTLTDTEKEALAWEALRKEHPGKTKEELIAEGYKNVRFEGDVTKAEWTVTQKTEYTKEDTETLNKVLVAESSDNFTFSGENNSILTVDGKEYTKGADGKYTRTEKDSDNKTTTTYTVTLTDEELTDETTITNMLAKEFGINASGITLNKGSKTATYTDGETTVTIDYSKLKKTTLTIDKSVDESVQKTVDTRVEGALDKAYEELWDDIQKKRDVALSKGEQLWVGHIQVTETTVKEDIITYLKTAVTHADMTPEQLIAALNAQKELAKKTKVTVNEGTRFEETLDNYYSGKGDFYHTYAPYGGFLGTAKGDYIRHLDLASDAQLNLLPGKDGKSETTDCVLVNPKLEWNYSAENLLADQSMLKEKDQNHNVGLDNKISYDEATGEKKGHFEYERGDNNNHPKASAFYKVTGTVAYGKQGNAYKATPSGRDLFGNKYYTDEDYAAARGRAEAALAKYKAAYPDAQVVEICKDQNERGARYYQIYLYQSDLTAYGYMTRDANVCTNATAYKQIDSTEYFGGYDLMISKLVQTKEGKVVGENQSTIKTIFAPIGIRSSSTKTKSSMTVGTKTTSTPVKEEAPARHGTQTNGEYKYDVDRKEEQIMEQSGTGEGHYKSFTNLIHNVFNGQGNGTVESGFIKYEYHTEKNKDGTPVKFEADKMVVTTKQDAEVHYTFTSQESRDVWIKGYTQTVVPPVNPGPDSPELPPVEDAKPAPAPAPAPETPVLPVVQDARPDPAPAPAPAPAPETPVLPAVQDAKLIQTGTSGWLADLMLGAGMVLSAAGYWMERKRKAMFYKSQH